MASAKQFLGNKTLSNAKIAAQVKKGTRCKILEVEIKEAPVTKEPVIAFRVKECDGWIRVNVTNLVKLSTAFGDDTDTWVGKSVTIDHFSGDVMGKMQIQLAITPAKG